MNNNELYYRQIYYRDIDKFYNALKDFEDFYIEEFERKDIQDRHEELTIGYIRDILEYLLPVLNSALDFKFSKDEGYEKTKEFFKKKCDLREEDIVASKAIKNIILTNLDWLNCINKLDKVVKESIDYFLHMLYYKHISKYLVGLSIIRDRYIKYILEGLGNKNIDLKNPKGDFKAETLYAIKNRTVDECCITENNYLCPFDKRPTYKEKSKNGKINWGALKKKFYPNSFKYDPISEYETNLEYIGWITFKNSNTYLRRERGIDGVERWVELPLNPKLKDKNIK